MCSTLRPSLHMSRDRSLHCLHKSRTCPRRKDQIQSLISSSLFGHFGQKGGENFVGELRKSLHNVRGSIGLGLETLVISSQMAYLCLLLAFITTSLCLCFYCFHLKLQYTLCLFSVFIQFVIISMLCSIFFFFFCAFKILPICLKYFILVP